MWLARLCSLRTNRSRKHLFGALSRIVSPPRNRSIASNERGPVHSVFARLPYNADKNSQPEGSVQCREIVSLALNVGSVHCPPLPCCCGRSVRLASLAEHGVHRGLRHTSSIASFADVGKNHGGCGSSRTGEIMK